MDNFLLNIVLVQVVKAGKYFNCDLLNIQKVYLRGNRKKKKGIKTVKFAEIITF